MRFIAHTFSMGRVGLYFVLVSSLKNISQEPMHMLIMCGFQNSGLKSNRYESPLLVISYISLFIDLQTCQFGRFE